jgi:hypothetical protein
MGMNTEPLRDIEWHMYKTGDYYGYPRCCIKEFMETFYTFGKRTDKQKKASNGLGFIPCVKHAEEILEGKIKVEDLILPTRKHTTPFLKHKN